MSKVYTKEINKNISLTDRRQILIKNSLFCIANIEDMLTSRITEGQKRHFKTKLKQTPITIMIMMSFTHFKWSTSKELI